MTAAEERLISPGLHRVDSLPAAAEERRRIDQQLALALRDDPPPDPER